MSFWTQQNLDPKMKHRFRVTITDISKEFAWYAKTVDKPSFKFSPQNENELYLGEVFPDTKILTNPSWQNINITLVDVYSAEADPENSTTTIDLTTSLVKLLQEAKYGTNSYFEKNFKEVIIEQLDSNGKPLELWTLVSPILIDVNFGNLDYSSSEFIEIKLTWSYSTVKYTMYDSDKQSIDILSPTKK